MARYIGPLCRQCRREGMKLFLKGARCNTEKCAVVKRESNPGQHGAMRKKLSNYGMQLREKQKVKRMYGILERQFRRYFHFATKSKGVTGKMLLQFLERRLDNVILRSGFALSRNNSRQIIRHNHVLVNDQRVNIPSYLVKADDIVKIINDEKTKKNTKDNIEFTKNIEKPKWLDINETNLTIKIARLPEKEDIPVPIEEQLIIELYSK